MALTYTFHRFESEAAFRAVFAAARAAGIRSGIDVDYDVMGTVYAQGAQNGTDPETGQPTYQQVARPGWHVNAAWRVDMPDAFAAAQVYPETPSRVFAGAAMSADAVWTTEDGVAALDGDGGMWMEGTP